MRYLVAVKGCISLGLGDLWSRELSSFLWKVSRGGLWTSKTPRRKGFMYRTKADAIPASLRFQLNLKKIFTQMINDWMSGLYWAAIGQMWQTIPLMNIRGPFEHIVLLNYFVPLEQWFSEPGWYMIVYLLSMSTSLLSIYCYNFYQ